MANRLINLLGTIYMDIYDPNQSYPRVTEELARLEQASPEEILEALSARDTEGGTENTPLMYACIFLRTEWIELILELASRVEPNHAFCRTLFSHRNANRENALVLLVEAEIIDVEETGENMPMDRIRLMIQHGANPNDDVGGPSAHQFAEENGPPIRWNDMGQLRHKKNKALVYGKRNPSRRRNTRLHGSLRRNKFYGHKVHTIRSHKGKNARPSQ
jgi:hypothetical protein